MSADVQYHTAKSINPIIKSAVQLRFAQIYRTMGRYTDEQCENSTSILDFIHKAINPAKTVLPKSLHYEDRGVPPNKSPHPLTLQQALKLKARKINFRGGAGRGSGVGVDFPFYRCGLDF